MEDPRSTIPINALHLTTVFDINPPLKENLLQPDCARLTVSLHPRCHVI